MSAYRDAVLSDSPSFAYTMTGYNNQFNLVDGGPMLNATGANSPNFAVPSNLEIADESSQTMYFNNAAGLKFMAGDIDPAFDLASGDFTLEAWANLDDGIGYRTIARCNYTTGLYLLRRSTSGAWEGFAGAIVTGTTPIVDDVFYHVVFTRSGTVGKIYVNGVLENTVSGQSNASGLGNLIVGAASGGSEVWQGSISWLAGYKTALSGARVMAHYKASFPKKNEIPGVGGIGFGSVDMSKHMSV